MTALVGMFFSGPGAAQLYLLKQPDRAEFKEEREMERNQQHRAPTQGASPRQNDGKEVQAR